MLKNHKYRVYFQVDYFLVLKLIGVFILCTIIGTLSHEMGHYAAAKYYGCQVNLHYASVTFSHPLDPQLDEIYDKYTPEQITKEDFIHKARLQELAKQRKGELFWITLAGVLQTLITGTLGIFFLWYYRGSFIEKDNLSYKQWLLIFISLFWLRQPANFFMAMLTYIILGKQSYGDEFALAYHLGLSLWSIAFITAIIGLLVLFWIVWCYIPIQQRFTFLVAGLVGGSLGFYLWIIALGKYILP